jgi:hypothetical protein
MQSRSNITCDMTWGKVEFCCDERALVKSFAMYGVTGGFV